MPEEDNTKAKDIMDKGNKTADLFEKRMDEVFNERAPSLLKLASLAEMKEKSLHDAEDKVESMINKSIERGIAKGECGFQFQVQYLAARAVRLKERKEFTEEKNKFFAENKSKLSAVDYVVDIMETEMPSYTDPED